MGILSSIVRSAERRGRRRGRRRPGRRGGQIVLVWSIIPELIAGVEVEANRKVAETAEKIAQDARGRAPVQTGRLRDSITASAYGKEAEVFSQVEYAPFVEYGTYKMAAQPFLYPAVEANKDGFFEWSGFFEGFRGHRA
jgi:HK97 gp10 family phage protein